MKKAAVVIGVNKTQDNSLQELQSAAAGAKAVANWLEGEDYDVECLTDETEPVTASAVFNAVLRFADLPVSYDLLLVYFSGHGYWVSRADYWLLSGAPKNPNESINLVTSMDLAKFSGISNIVFISDACRSIPANRSGQLLSGSDVFPNHSQIMTPSKIDMFKATSESLPAYEVKLEGTSQSVLTHALMSAYKEPTAGMVSELETEAGIIRIIPNRKLEGYLQGKVNDILARTAFTKTQRLEINVPSDDRTYIARAYGDDQNVGTPRQINDEVLTRNLAFPVDRMFQPHPNSSDDDLKIKAMIPDMQTDHFESGAGFVISGAGIREVACTKGRADAWAEILVRGDSQGSQALVRLWNVEPSVSVLIELEDRRSVILACLPGYIGHATFDANGLMNVSYLPSSNNWRWGMVQGILPELNQLRAEAALATVDNTFRLDSPQAARALAQKIRVGKSVDPSLGLYAATAFAQASMDDKVKSVMDYMRSDLNVDLFDVRLLASHRPEQLPGNEHYLVTPICPMLTQNWHLLASRGIQLPAVLEKAKPYLSDALWTTFGAEATEDLMQAFKSGELK